LVLQAAETALRQQAIARHQGLVLVAVLTGLLVGLILRLV
jgi:hypothetical protein